VIVTGSVNPLMLNAELLELAAVTVTLAPLAVKLPDAVPLFPTTTLPTGSGFGVALSVPAVEVPVPDRVMPKLGLDAFDVTVTLPLALPEFVGVNVTLKVALPPAPSDTGVEIPPKLNPAPLIATLVITAVSVPAFLIVSERD
jgi:hypothetical protein